MRSKPVAEGGHKSRSGGRFLNWLALADPVRNEVMVEELHSEVGVIANLSALEMSAGAPAKMAAKGIKYVEIDLLQNAASSLNKAAEMSRGSNVSDGAGWCVSFAFEVVCERIDVWPSDFAPKASQRFGREEVVL